MDVSFPELVTWLIVGALAGSLTGLVVTRTKEGFGRFVNLGIGLVGALIGGFLFDLFSIDLGLANITISLADVLAGFIGALIFLLVLWYGRKLYHQKDLGKIRLGQIWKKGIATKAHQDTSSP
jgi:uncharacterized membrane protein YeaQ/YmgE (transglycosylase-associated protein family)